MADSLQAWLSRLETLHPKAIDLGLDRVRQVAIRLGLLPLPCRVLTIAGTNGKGSVAWCAAALAAAAGWRTGRYTSPHLLHFNERIVIDGEFVADARIVQALEAVDTAREDTSLTYFEFTTLAALWLFREAEVDLAVLEVGLGGRLDAVNIVDADVGVITAIGLDHQAWLGDTVEAIAVEKAGIARAGQPLVLAESAYPDSLWPALAACGARALRAGSEWHWSVDGHAEAGELRVQCAGERIELPVPAGLQPANVAAAVLAIWELGGAPPPAQEAAAALAALRIPGRQQRLLVDGIPLLLDVAHNGDGAQALAVAVAQQRPRGSIHALCGLLADKDPLAVCGPLLPLLHSLTLCALPVARAAAPEQVYAQLAAHCPCPIQLAAGVAEGWQRLRPRLGADDLLLVFGSFHTVGGMLSEVVEALQPDATPTSRMPEATCSSSA